MPRRINIVHTFIILNLILFFGLSFLNDYLETGFKRYIFIINILFSVLYLLSLKKIIPPENVELEKLNFTNLMEIRSYGNFGIFNFPVRWTNKAIIYLDKDSCYFYYNLTFLPVYFYGPFEIDYFAETKKSHYKLDDVVIENDKITFCFSHRKIYSKFEVVLMLKDGNDYEKINFLKEKMSSISKEK